MNSWNPMMQFEIPTIDGKSGLLQPSRIEKEERQKLNKLLNGPTDISGRGLLGKIAGGLLVGAMMSVVLVLLMYAFWLAIGSWEVMSGSGVGISQETHPLAWLILLFWGFVVTFFGSLLLLVFYSVFFSNKYTNIRKTTGLLLLTNTILFVMMMVFFVVFQQINGSEVVLFALYVCIAVFLSFAQIEFMVNPNYASSALSGSTIGFALALIVLGIMRENAHASVDHSAPYMLVWMSTLIVFPLMIFGQGIWDIVYYKIYETGANPFYIPSHAELDTQTILENQRQEAEKEAITVEL